MYILQSKRIKTKKETRNRKVRKKVQQIIVFLKGKKNLIARLRLTIAKIELVTAMVL